MATTLKERDTRKREQKFAGEQNSRTQNYPFLCPSLIEYG